MFISTELALNSLERHSFQPEKSRHSTRAQYLRRLRQLVHFLFRLCSPEAHTSDTGLTWSTPIELATATASLLGAVAEIDVEEPALKARYAQSRWRTLDNYEDAASSELEQSDLEAGADEEDEEHVDAWGDAVEDADHVVELWDHVQASGERVRGMPRLPDRTDPLSAAVAALHQVLVLVFFTHDDPVQLNPPESPYTRFLRFGAISRGLAPRADQVAVFCTEVKFCMRLAACHHLHRVWSRQRYLPNARNIEQ